MTGGKNRPVAGQILRHKATGERVAQLISIYCRSYSPLFTRFKTVKPAFLASEMDRLLGELKEENTLRTGFLHAGHRVNGAAEIGRRRVNFPPQALHSPSHNSYSYNGIPVENPISLETAVDLNRRKRREQRVPGLHQAQHPHPARYERGEDRKSVV